MQMTIVGRAIATVVAVSAGAYMAINAIDGWGWLLFAGVCLVPSYKESGTVGSVG